MLAPVSMCVMELCSPGRSGARKEVVPVRWLVQSKDVCSCPSSQWAPSLEILKKIATMPPRKETLKKIMQLAEKCQVEKFLKSSGTFAAKTTASVVVTPVRSSALLTTQRNGGSPSVTGRSVTAAHLHVSPLCSHPHVSHTLMTVTEEGIFELFQTANNSKQRESS